MKIRFGQICRLYTTRGAITKATRNSLSGSDRFLLIVRAVACANELYKFSFFAFSCFHYIKSLHSNEKTKICIYLIK